MTCLGVLVGASLIAAGLEDGEWRWKGCVLELGDSAMGSGLLVISPLLEPDGVLTGLFTFNDGLLAVSGMWPPL